nr:unnamed protein product [Digitaria exilis]
MSEEAKYLETARADRSLWLMKCPTVVSRAWQEAAAAAPGPDAGGANPNPSPVVAKVILSLDPLRDDDMPSQASLLPLPSRKLACEGKVEKKFDMKPHRENLMDYGKLCRERTNMSMVKPRKTELILDDNGKGMRPLPVHQLIPPGPKQFLKEILNEICVYNKRGPNQGTHELKPEYKKYTEDKATN